MTPATAYPIPFQHQILPHHPAHLRTLNSCNSHYFSGGSRIGGLFHLLMLPSLCIAPILTLYCLLQLPHHPCFQHRHGSGGVQFAILRLSPLMTSQSHTLMATRQSNMPRPSSITIPHCAQHVHGISFQKIYYIDYTSFMYIISHSNYILKQQNW